MPAAPIPTNLTPMTPTTPTIDNVTVIVPAHNRPGRLRRLLDYYRATGARILVPDSSDAPFDFDPRRWPHAVYIHRPRLHFLLKIREVLPMISTPYTVYCADDDFAVPSGLAACARFLDEHPAYSCAQGHYLTFTPRPDGSVRFSPRYIRGFLSRVDAPTPLGRLRGQQGIYAPLLYALVRTEAFRTIYSYCFDAQGQPLFRNLFLAEEFFNHSMLIRGAYATLPCFFSARECIPGSATSTTVPISVVKTAPEYRPEYEAYIHALARELADAQPMAEAEAVEAVRMVTDTPRDPLAVRLKRRVNALIESTPLLAWAARLSAARYRAKGLRAVRGMASYPCQGPSPDRDAIVRAVTGSRL